MSEELPASPPDRVQRWMPGVEMVRGLAAVMVVLHHLWSLSTMPRFAGYWIIEGFGSFGVNIFFVLSAFLLSPPCWSMKSAIDVRRFWARRSARILPAYLVNVTILFLFFVPAGVLFTYVGARQVLANLTFTHYLFPTTSSSLGTNGVLWTLTIEVMLYLLLPLIGWLFARAPVLVFGVMSLVGWTWRIWIGVKGDGLRSFYFGDLGVPQGIQSLFIARQFVGFLPLFALGMGARWLFERHPTFFTTRVRQVSLPLVMALLLPGALFLRFVERASQYSHWLWFTMFDTVIGVLIVPAILVAASGAARPNRMNRFGEWLGARSYGIYLWHFPLVLVAYERGIGLAPPVHTNVWARIAFVLAFTALLAEVSYRAIEMPAQRWARGRQQRWSAQ